MSYTPPVTRSDGDLIDASIWNSDLVANIIALKDPPNAQVIRDNNGVYSTTSTSFVDVDSTNLKHTIITNGGSVLAWFTGWADLAAAYYGYFNLAVDDTDLAYTNGLSEIYTRGMANFVVLIAGLSAGSHSFALRWRRESAGTLTLSSDSGDHPVIFGVREVS